ncbi:MAG: UDP-N-acetylmuramate dehydrogenase [Candidatus Nanopelagicales bacterium]
MDRRTDLRLADLTTLRVGGPARAVVVVYTEEDLVAAVHDAGEAALVVGGGSNLLVGDQGYDGTAVVVRTRGVGVQVDDAEVRLDLAAGEVWDDVVAGAVAEGWGGVEALSGIPGLVGATPMQNVGAYGQQVSETIARVRTFDRVTGRRRSFAAADCGFDYRTSRFKAEPGRFVVLGVELSLSRGAEGTVDYSELARSLGVGVGDRVPLRQSRDAVLELRRSKGMLLDPSDHDTWSAGSFFTNPVLTAEGAAALPAAAPRFPQAGGLVKTSAAWLIENAGFARGYTLDADTSVALSGKHSLAITNTGGATAAAVVALATHLRQGVRDRFGITLEPEPVLVGCTLG